MVLALALTLVQGITICVLQGKTTIRFEDVQVLIDIYKIELKFPHNEF